MSKNGPQVKSSKPFREMRDTYFLAELPSRILRGTLEGYSAAQLATSLGCNERTITRHRKQLRDQGKL